jgi:hypothetical protein
MKIQNNAVMILNSSSKSCMAASPPIPGINVNVIHVYPFAAGGETLPSKYG